jgi:phage/plasmid-associated DNA primase
MEGFKLDTKILHEISEISSQSFVEYVDVEKLDKAIEFCKGNDDMKWTYNVLIKIKGLMKNDCITVSYHLNNDEGYDRYHVDNKFKSSISLASVQRPIRHYLCNDNYVDIDLVAAQPSILLSLYEAHKMPEQKPLSSLKEYVLNRNDKIKEVMDFYECSKQQAKSIFNSLTNLGSLEKELERQNISNKLTMPFLREYRNDITKLYFILVKENDELVDFLKKKKSLDKITGAEFMGNYYQTVERLVLDTAYHYLKDKEIITNCFIPCHDGFMIPKNCYYEGLEKDIISFVSDHTCFKYINYVVKPFDEAIDIDSKEITIEDKMNILKKKISNDVIGFIENRLGGERPLAELFLEVYRDDFICVEKQLYYVNNYNVWVQDTKQCSYLVSKFDKFSKELFKYTYYIFNEYKFSKDGEKQDLKLVQKQLDKCINILKEHKKVEHVTDSIKVFIGQTKFPFDNNYDLFAFNNLVLDMSETKNIHIRKIHKKDLIFTTTDYDLLNSTKENRNKLIELLKTIQPESDMLEDMIWIFARSMYGLSPERMYMLNGSGGNGKGLMAELNNATFGNYYSQLNPTVLSKPLIVGGSPEVGKLQGKRMVVSPEINKNLQADSQTIKSLTGGNKVNGRMLFECKDELKQQFTLFTECNGWFNMTVDTSDALDRRLVDILFPSQFVSDISLVDNKRVFLRNDSYKSPKFIESVRSELAWLYIESLKKYGVNKKLCDKIMNRTAQYFSENKDIFISWFRETFEFNNSFDMDTVEGRKDILDKEKFSKVSYIFDLFKKSEVYKNLEKNQKSAFKVKTIIELLKKNFANYFMESFRLNSKEVTVFYKNIIIGFRKSFDESNEKHLDCITEQDI